MLRIECHSELNPICNTGFQPMRVRTRTLEPNAQSAIAQASVARIRVANAIAESADYDRTEIVEVGLWLTSTSTREQDARATFTQRDTTKRNTTQRFTTCESTAQNKAKLGAPCRAATNSRGGTRVALALPRGNAGRVVGRKRGVRSSCCASRGRSLRDSAKSIETVEDFLWH
jgi:hypothetical protein